MAKSNLVIETVDIKTKDIEKIITWKVWYDKKSGLPCGQGFMVCVCGLGENLPVIPNKAHWVEERECYMIIKKKKR